MKDIGVDRRQNAVEQSAPTSVNSEKSYPGLSLNDSVVDQLKGKDVGEMVELKFKIKVLGKRVPEDWDDIQQGTYFSCEIREVGEPE